VALCQALEVNRHSSHSLCTTTSLLTCFFCTLLLCCTDSLSVTAQPVYAALAAAAADLCSVVHSDFGASPADVSHDVFNNALHLKRAPKQPLASSSDSSSDKLQYHHPYDRNNRSLKNRYTTPRVEVGQHCSTKHRLLCSYSSRLIWCCSFCTAIICDTAPYRSKECLKPVQGTLFRCHCDACR
jgi:hypothetical protein